MDAKTIAMIKALGGGKLPFGETKQTVEVLAECQPTMLDIGEEVYIGYIVGQLLGLVVGEKYTVNWNGVDYEAECVAPERFGGSVVGLGNMMDYGGTDNELPFAVMNFPKDFTGESDDMVCVSSFDGSTSVALSIKQEQTVVTPLPVKYLPDGYPYAEVENVNVLPETTLTVNDNGQAALPDALNVVVGGTYTVTWKDTDYVCVAQEYEMDGIICSTLGNLSAFGGTDTGEPFAMLVFPADIAAAQGMGAMVIPMDGSTAPTIAIRGEVEVVHPIDEKYLPDTGIPTVSLSIYGVSSVALDAEVQSVELDAEKTDALAKIMQKGLVKFWVDADGTFTPLSGIGRAGSVTIPVTIIRYGDDSFYGVCIFPDGKKFRVELESSNKKLYVSYTSA